MSKKIPYPFIAKSTAYLEAGQFWAIALHEPGYYGCGRVLQTYPSTASNAKRWFIAGLMAWVDTKPPTTESIANCEIIQQMDSHCKEIDSPIVGCRSLELDNLEPLLWLNASGSDGSNPHGRPSLMRGVDKLGEATVAEHKELVRLGRTWALGNLNVNHPLLERLIMQHQTRVR